MNDVQRKSLINELLVAAYAIELCSYEGAKAQAYTLSVLRNLFGGPTGLGGMVGLLDGQQEREAAHRLWKAIIDQESGARTLNEADREALREKGKKAAIAILNKCDRSRVQASRQHYVEEREQMRKLAQREGGNREAVRQEAFLDGLLSQFEKEF